MMYEESSFATFRLNLLQSVVIFGVRFDGSEKNGLVRQ